MGMTACLYSFSCCESGPKTCKGKDGFARVAVPSCPVPCGHDAQCCGAAALGARMLCHSAGHAHVHAVWQHCKVDP
eukprot:365180-Chlamydomonas_euryale.AAC.12